MNKREVEYPVELESQFILRIPEEPAKSLREMLRSGENIKNRLSIQMENDMRHGEVRFDHWLLHGKIVDLPTIVESLKTIDKKSVYKTADICQMMICKDELEPPSAEEDSPNKSKKKDPFKVDKKFLYPHGITPPTKNVRKRRFRKTLKKKCMEAPEIEKEVKRLLRADNEAVSFTWEVITEENDSNPKTEVNNVTKSEKAKTKKELKAEASQSSSKVEDIFGGALSDSDLEEENVNVDIEDSRMSAYDDHMSDSSSIHGTGEFRGSSFATQFQSDMFQGPQAMTNLGMYGPSTSTQRESSVILKSSHPYSSDEFMQQSTDKGDLSLKLQQLGTELEELKQRKQRTQHEISGMENMTLRQRFEDILKTLNQEILYKEREYKNALSLLK